VKPTDRKAITEFPTRHLSRKQHWAPKLDRVPFPHSLPGRKVLVLSIAEGLALGLWGRLMLRHEFIILIGGVAILPRAARAQVSDTGHWVSRQRSPVGLELPCGFS
jgi:hypothetical protein